MTPRESLEAAGWIRTPLYQGRWTDPVTKISCSEAAAILTQLARDEAKETSDAVSGDIHVGNGGGRRDSNSGSGMNSEMFAEKLWNDLTKLPCGESAIEVKTIAAAMRDYAASAAPAATSVSAPDAEMIEKAFGEFIGGPLTVSRFITVFHPIFEAYAREYASSSSAALLAANEVIRRQLKKVCDQAEAAEAKCAETLEVLKKACDRDWKDETLYQAAVIASNAIYWRDQEIEAKCAELQKWKESQMDCTPDYQEIGKLLDVRWGESVHDKIIPGILALRDSRDRLREALRVALVPLAALVISGECLAAPTALSEELKVAIVSGHDAVLAALNPVPDTE